MFVMAGLHEELFGSPQNAAALYAQVEIQAGIAKENYDREVERKRLEGHGAKAVVARCGAFCCQGSGLSPSTLSSTHTEWICDSGSLALSSFSLSIPSLFEHIQKLE